MLAFFNTSRHSSTNNRNRTSRQILVFTVFQSIAWVNGAALKIRTRLCCPVKIGFFVAHVCVALLKSASLLHVFVQTPSTGLRHPPFGGRCRKALFGVWCLCCPIKIGFFVEHVCVAPLKSASLLHVCVALLKSASMLLMFVLPY